MKKGLTELVFILDRSGSMSGLEADTIGGFNAMIEKQKKEEGDALVTTVLFDHHVELLHDRFALSQVKPLTGDDYFVRGSTALLDAVGQAITKIDNVRRHLPEEERPEHVIFVITTDGMENASRKYSYNQIRNMIEAQKELGWEFMFLGANIDAPAEAHKMGIDADRAVTFYNDSEGIELNYKTVSNTICKMRAMDADCAPIGAEWKADIEKDVKRRDHGDRSRGNQKKWFVKK